MTTHVHAPIRRAGGHDPVIDITVRVVGEEAAHPATGPEFVTMGSGPDR